MELVFILSMILALMIFLLTFIIFNKKNAKKEKKSGIPGPEGNNHGNLIAKHNGMKPFSEWLHSKYGDVVEFYLSPESRIISIQDPVLIKQTLSMGDRPRDLFKFIEPLFGEYNFQVYNAEDAKNTRRLVNKGFNHLIIKEKMNDFIQMSQSLFDQWEEDYKNGKSIPMQQSLLKYSFESSLFLASDVTLPEEKFLTFYNSYNITINAYIAKQYGLPVEVTDEELGEASDFLTKTWKEIYDLHEVKDEENLLTILKTKIDPVTGEKFTEENAIMILSIFILAAYHTSVVATSFVIYLLCLHEDTQEEVRNEINQYLPDNQELTYDNIKDLPLLNRVINESLRLYTPGPFAARITTEPITIKSDEKQYNLPENTTIFYPICCLHINEKYWDNPLDFNPDRFLKENTKKRHALAFSPFGFGLRKCPGNVAAWNSIRSLLCQILRRYRLKLDETVEVVTVEKFVLWAKDDIHVFTEPIN
eukprot:TRINITY_DN2141_c0_g1_i1.p1 TRINITY_DN2141_c0_g1~~TRINITY_DN2141_c0_g1_i1.p1  ORF type:complete len:476 (-),score=122.39 TRINITY_DN2141_c0_g1_i1:249-1676(-)